MATLCLAKIHRVEEEDVANCRSANKKEDEEEETKPAVLTIYEGIILWKGIFYSKQEEAGKGSSSLGAFCHAIQTFVTSEPIWNSSCHHSLSAGKEKTTSSTLMESELMSHPQTKSYVLR